MMMVNFEFLSEPLRFIEGEIKVLCLEDKKLFRDIYAAFVNGELEEKQIVFSENYSPLKSKGNICVIDDYFRLSFSNSMMKKIYEMIEKHCNGELQKETVDLKTHIVNYMELVTNSYDYDFEFDYDVNLIEIFKALSLKLAIECDNILNGLLDFILLLNKYASQKCFVLMNLHLYFSKNELDLFYRDILNNHVELLVVENNNHFEKCEVERIIVIDSDYCEIVETEQIM